MTHPMVEAFVAAMTEHADPDKGRQMAAYLKTDMPCYGVQKKLRRELTRGYKKRFPLASRAEVESLVRELWALPHREDKYMAIEVARMHPKLIGGASMALYERLIVEGAWWDLVDDVAANLVGIAFKKEREALEPTIVSWGRHQDMWLRRTAIISQLRHKDETDQALLFSLCRSMFDEKEFFIRKAIGWALRQYSYTNPQAVADFLEAHADEMSGLSYREGKKALTRLGHYEGEPDP